MATATKVLSKTGFVKEFFLKHPDGNVRAVNEAWQAAGNKDTIGDTLIYGTKADLARTGNQRPQKTTVAAKATTSSRPEAPQTLGKTSFVKEFLKKHPESTSRDVNDAWLKAGMKDTISHTVVSEARKQLGLLGNVQVKEGNVAKPKSARKKSKTGGTPGKTLFTKEYLIDQPLGNVKAVNDAWKSAGMKGKISHTLINKLRGSMGLAGNLRGTPTTKTTEKVHAQPSARIDSKPAAQPQANTNDRSSALLDVETEIDRLIFSVMGIGNLAEIESVLRDARRKVYGAMNS